MLNMTLLHQKYRYRHVCYGSVYQKAIFEKYIFMSIRLIPVQTNVHFKIVQLIVVMFDISCLRRAIHVVYAGVTYYM